MYCRRNVIVIFNTYNDRAMSDTNDNRPDFQRMLRDSGKREWDFVLVYKLDRFSRDKYAATVNKRKLKDNDVKLLSAMENIPDTPEGIILESLLEGMSYAEIAKVIQRAVSTTYDCLKAVQNRYMAVYG
ncbi:MAG: recombinase family protein [Clostridia bacterium]|nr:recombinase family protein [Clostridia bacterium]